MKPIQHFLAYAQDFEQTYDDDDWSRLRHYFAPDAVYEVKSPSFPCRLVGVDAILRGIKKSLDGFDRRLTKRELGIADGPTETEDSVSFGWTATYAKPGAPSFVLRGRSTARYAGDVIRELVDEYTAADDAAAGAWLREHAPGLDVGYI